MPIKIPKLKLQHFYCVALLSASILFGCAVMLGPGEAAEDKRVSIDILVAEDDNPGIEGIEGIEKAMPPVSASTGLHQHTGIENQMPQSGLIAGTTAIADELNTPVETISEPELTLQHFTVKPGDSMYRLFSKAGLTPQHLNKVSASAADSSWTRLYPGEKVTFGFADEQFQTLQIQRSRLEKLHISSSDTGAFSFENQKIEPAIQLAYAEGTINSSLFVDAKNAGISDTLTMELANIFGWDIDFIMDIRKGDRFKLLYEEKYLDDEHIGEGNILSAQFVNRGKVYTAVRYEDSKGRVSYYTPAGDSMKKAFRRSPIDFARVSSHFNLKRKHPVLHKIRAHRGTDYAARRGTPIKSTGSGKVIFAGRKGGYGKVVIIQHGQAISTLYAHMKGFAKGIRSGKRVVQGQIIGYVGSTGMATGPHLHYEFRVNGIHKNPLTVKLPKAHPVAKSELGRFQKQAEIAVAQLDSLAKGYQLAKSESNSPTRDL